MSSSLSEDFEVINREQTMSQIEFQKCIEPVINHLKDIKVLLIKLMSRKKSKNTEIMPSESTDTIIQTETVFSPESKDKGVLSPESKDKGVQSKTIMDDDGKIAAQKFYNFLENKNLAEAQKVLDDTKDVTLWPKITQVEMFNDDALKYWERKSLFVQCCQCNLIDLESAGSAIRYVIFKCLETKSITEWLLPRITPKLAENLRQDICPTRFGMKNIVAWACMSYCNVEAMEFLYTLKDITSTLVFPRDKFWTKEQFEAGDTQNTKYIDWWHNRFSSGFNSKLFPQDTKETEKFLTLLKEEKFQEATSFLANSEISNWPKITDMSIFNRKHDGQNASRQQLFIWCCRRGLVDLVAAGSNICYLITDYEYHGRVSTQDDRDWFNQRITPEIAEVLRKAKPTNMNNNLVSYACWYDDSDIPLMKYLWTLKDTSGAYVFPKNQFWTKELFKQGDVGNEDYINFWIDCVFKVQE
jgi:hypothetical protein